MGAGPAGLMLAHLLQLEGIEAVVLEARSREHVEQRIRAGVLEQGTVDLLDASGRRRAHAPRGLVHHGIELQFDGERHRIPLSELAGGRTIVVYGQTEVVKDLIAARLASGAPLLFEVSAVSVHELASDRPAIRYEHEAGEHELECDFIAGCDGFHGVCRATIPEAALRTYAREYPFGWLGILAAVAPSCDELIYAHHERGFALHSLRSPELSRLYVQCRPDEDIAEWPDDRIWEELQLRLGLEGWTLAEGPVLEKGVIGMRSFVVEPMHHGRLYLAGDAAHIVPPTGAKGLNLAIADVRHPGGGARELARDGQPALLDALLRDLPAARLARRAFLLVDDLDAAPLARRRPVRAEAPAVAAAQRRLLARGRDGTGRELCRARAHLAGVRRDLRPADLLDELGDRAWLQAMLDSERALAQAEAAAGLIPAEAVEPIAAACRADLYDRERIGREGRGRATRPSRSCVHCARRWEARPPAMCTTGRPARTSSTRRRCSSAGAPSSSCWPMSRG